MATQREKDDPLYQLKIVQIKWGDIFKLFTSNEIDIICGEIQVNGNQRPFIKKILPIDMFDAMFSSSRSQDGYMSKSSFSRFFEVRKSQINSSYKKAYEYLMQINPDTGKPYTYEDAYFIKDVANNWRNIIEKIQKQDNEFENRLTIGVRSLISDYIDDEKDQLDLTKSLSELLDKSLVDTLTRLTFIASTINYWDGEQINDELYEVIQKPVLNDGHIEYKEQRSVENQILAEEKIKIARDRFNFSSPIKDEYKNAISECCEACQTIVGLRPLVERQLRGEAYYMLYICAKEREYRIPSGDSRDQYLIQSNKCGYNKAQEEYLRVHPNSLIEKVKSSEYGDIGVYIFNSNNERSLFLKRSCPKKSWDEMDFDRDNIDILISHHKPSKFFLLNDDFEKNIADALYVLQYLKEKSDKFHTNAMVEIYLRADEEYAAPLIDTALSHITNILVPVHIIDDNKSAAQHLLSSHPIYYPLHQLPMNSKATLNLVVIGDSKCADWIIREGFWMMSFRNPKIQCKITIVSDDPQSTIARLSGSCPGMFNADNCLGPEHKIDDISFASIEKEKSNLSTNSLKTVLKKLILKKDEYPYFVVCTDSDSYNLSCAIRIREIMIREYVTTNKISYLDSLPIITYKCENPDIAHLSKNMVVHNEAYGNRWYNSYVLIPFGSYSERYKWDTIDGGIVNKIAQCIHFEYNSIPIDVDKRDPNAIKDALMNYYGRYYDRDSSFSVALYMPYRLFQCNYDNYRTIPTHWSIEDENAFFTYDELSGLADRYSDVVKRTGENYESLGKLEHDRWVRWMCSRGWIPASQEAAADYINNGKNPRQQLYIAKMHPCMCGWGKLDALSKYLHDNCENFNKNFKNLDLENVKKTPEFLRIAWLERSEHELEIDSPEFIR